MRRCKNSSCGALWSIRVLAPNHRARIHALMLGVVIALSLNTTIKAYAQLPTLDPGAWRPVSYADLQMPSAATATYSDIWKDQIEANNRAYRDKGDLRFGTANAPATEAHFVIWSPGKSVVLSILNTARGCEVVERHPEISATIKLCPMRVVFYEGMAIQTLDAGRGCFLEVTTSSARPNQDAARAASYAAYDIAAKTVKIGVIVDHKAVEGCSRNIQLMPP